jgi:hypothetical protein
MAFPQAAVMLTGELRFHDIRADSGNTVSRGFCPDCGAGHVEVHGQSGAAGNNGRQPR